MYDLQKLHNQNLNYNGIKPYRSPNYDSIYQGITIEIHIVDHCNLNCANCNHFSPLAKPWYIDKSDFKKQLELLKNNIPTVKELLLLGGEPTLHPELIELCKIARNIFQDIDIRILSNGLKIQNIKKDIQLYKQYNIILDFCNYPGYTDIQTIKEIEGNYFATRNVTHQVLIDNEGTQNIEKNFYNCNKYRLPCFTLRDSKVFICPFIAHLHHYEKKTNLTFPLIENIDYLNLEKINNNLDLLQDFCFSPKNTCKYCNQKHFPQIWHQSSRDIVEYTVSFDDLYFKDYNKYYNITNNYFDYFLKCYDLNTPKEVDSIYEIDFTKKIMKRLGQGKIDIIIPHYNLKLNLAKQLISSLEKQTIIQDCVIYFISDNSPNEEELIKLIFKSNLNYVLLKQKDRKGPGEARNLGLIHSFNKYKFFLDADDYFCNSHSLEDLYNLAEKNSFDLIQFIMYANDQSGDKINYLIRQDLLRNNDIKYNNLYFGEDIVFSAQIISTATKQYNYLNTENIFAVYNRYNDYSISETLISYDNNHFNFITSRLIAGTLENLNIDFYSKYIINNLNTLYNNNKNIFCQDFNKLFLYWVYYNLYKKYPHFYKQCNYKDTKIIDFQNNNFFIILSDRIIDSEHEAFNYLSSYIKEYYLNNPYTHAAAELILNFY